VEFLEAIASWPGAELLRRSSIAYLLVNAAHILSIGLIIGAIATLDLRILGLFPNAPLATLGPPLSRMAATGIVFAILTGLVLFSVRPQTYAANPAFLVKIGLVALGLANALALQWSRGWREALSRQKISGPVRAAAIVSLMIWSAAILAGRWIGFL